MNTQIPDLEKFSERLATLEKENRRLKRVGGVVLALVAVAFVMGQTKSEAGKKAIPKIIEAQAFVLRDKDGKIRGRGIAVGFGFPSVNFFYRLLESASNFFNRKVCRLPCPF